MNLTEQMLRAKGGAASAWKLRTGGDMSGFDTFWTENESTILADVFDGAKAAEKEAPPDIEFSDLRNDVEKAEFIKQYGLPTYRKLMSRDACARAEKVRP